MRGGCNCLFLLSSLSTPTTTSSSLSPVSLKVPRRRLGNSACIALDNAISRLAYSPLSCRSYTLFRFKMSSTRPQLSPWPEQTLVANIQTPLPASPTIYGRSTRRRRRDTFKDHLFASRQVIADQQEIRTSSSCFVLGRYC